MKSHLIVVRFISTAITISFKFILIAFLEAFILMTYAGDIAGDKTKDTFFYYLNVSHCELRTTSWRFLETFQIWQMNSFNLLLDAISWLKLL